MTDPVLQGLYAYSLWCEAVSLQVRIRKLLDALAPHAQDARGSAAHDFHGEPGAARKGDDWLCAYA